MSIPNLRLNIPRAVHVPGNLIDSNLRGYSCIVSPENYPPIEMITGGFCYTFKLEAKGKKNLCLRVWYDDNTREKHLSHIENVSKYFDQNNLNHVIEYTYIPHALRIDSQTILPAVIMEWVEGDTLMQYVKKNYKKSSLIKKVADEFYSMVLYMHERGLSHGDLSATNLIVKHTGELYMIDYDSFYCNKWRTDIPISTEGVKCYQHPERCNVLYLNKDMDNFSQQIIYLSLLALSENPRIFNQNVDRGLLFQDEDVSTQEQLLQSQTYKKISAIKNQEIQLYLKELVRAIGGPLSAVRSLVDVKKEIDAKLHPARPVEHVPPLPSTPTTRNYQVTCLKCGKKITTTAEIKYCPYCGNLLQNNSTSTDSGFSENILELLEKLERGNKRREEEHRKYLAEQKRLAEERKFVNRWKKFWRNVWNALCGFFDEIAELIIYLLIFAILMLPIIGSIWAGCSVYYSKSGDKYFYGQEGQQQNYVQAVQEYKQIFPFITFNSKRTTNSTYNLATCHEYGLGTNKDSIQAFDRYLKAAKKGHIMAMNKVAQCYATGYGTIQSTEESSKWFEKSLRKGSAEDLLEVGWQYEIGNRLIQNYAQAMKCYTTAAEKGLVAAQMKLGDCYLTGTCGAQKNTTDAAKWYQMAANQGDGEATEILQLLSNKPTSRDINRWYQTGDKYYFGNNGVKIDYAEAIKWYRIAALMGHADAQNDFGVCYELGRGLNEDDVEAVKWYRKSAAQGYKYAQNNLGLCYAHGRGLNEDDVEAVKWFRKAAEQGHADAQNNLGNRLYNGKGIIKNYTEAAKWFRKSAENGNQYAQYNLGRCYQYGQGIIKNYAEAAKWYRKSAENGNQYAQYNLGWCYQYGQGVTKNLTEAKKWYQKAADKGNESAKKKLVELNQ